MINPTNYIYDLAKVCTEASNQSSLTDDQIDAIEAKISDIQDYAQAEPQARYILCNRLAHLQKSLKEDSPKVEALKVKLGETLGKIKDSLPESFLKFEPTFFDEAFPEGVKEGEFFRALVTQFPPTSPEKIKEFIGSMKIMYQQAQPELYKKLIAAWIDYHEIPIRDLPLSFDSLLEIIPYIKYVDLQSAPEKQFYEDTERFLGLLEKSNPTYLSLENGIITGWISTFVGIHSLYIPNQFSLNEKVFQIISSKKNLESLNLKNCELDTGVKLECLKDLPKLTELQVLNLNCDADPFRHEIRKLAEQLPHVTVDG